MGKKQKKVTQQREFTSSKKKANEAQGEGMGMESLLDSSVLNQLKAAAESMRQEQEQLKQRQAEEERARQAEQKRLENDFAYLLEKSDARAHKYK